MIWTFTSLHRSMEKDRGDISREGKPPHTGVAAGKLEGYCLGRAPSLGVWGLSPTEGSPIYGSRDRKGSPHRSMGWWESVGIWSIWETQTAPAKRKIVILLFQNQPGKWTSVCDCGRGHLAVLGGVGGSLLSTPSRDFEAPSILWKGFGQRAHQRGDCVAWEEGWVLPTWGTLAAPLPPPAALLCSKVKPKVLLMSPPAGFKVGNCFGLVPFSIEPAKLLCSAAHCWGLWRMFSVTESRLQPPWEWMPAEHSWLWAWLGTERTRQTDLYIFLFHYHSIVSGTWHRRWEC